jgi:hypothetical protein
MTVRKGVARCLQGATNLTHNQLSQHVMKLAQEQEGLHQKSKAGSSRSKSKKKQTWEAAALQAIAEQDVDMACK